MGAGAKREAARRHVAGAKALRVAADRNRRRRVMAATARPVVVRVRRPRVRPERKQQRTAVPSRPVWLPSVSLRNNLPTNVASFN